MNRKNELLELISIGLPFLVGCLLLISDSTRILGYIGMGMIAISIILTYRYLFRDARDTIKDGTDQINEGKRPEIDDLRWHYAESDNHLERQRRNIYYYYNSIDYSNDVRGHITRLIKRKNYLESRIRSEDGMVNVISTLTLSIIASSFFELIPHHGDMCQIIRLIGAIIAASILLVMVNFSLKASRVVSLQDSVDQYEIKIIDDKISELQEKVEQTYCTDVARMRIEGDIIRFQDYLKKHIWDCRKKMGKSAEDVKKLINEIDSLNLHINDSSSYGYFIEVTVDGVKGYIAYDSFDKYVSEDFKRLNEIVDSLQPAMQVSKNDKLPVKINDSNFLA